MRKLLALALLATGCATYVPQPAAVYDGNPCDQMYFDQYACRQAVLVGGWYVGGILYHLSGGYDYDYYYRRETVYVQHGGRPKSYQDAVKSVRPASPGTYTPPARNASTQTTGTYTPPARTTASSGGYTPPARTTPSSSYTPPARTSTYTPPTRSSSSSSSYSPPSRSSRK